jgi:hypothetical protein
VALRAKRPPGNPDRIRAFCTPIANDSHPDAEPIQIVFDFSMNLAELEAADDVA